MKKGRKPGAVLIGFCFCIVGMLLFMSPTASAESKILHEGYCGYLEDRNWDDIDHFNGPNVKFRLYDDGTMVISGHGKMESYLYYEDCCIKYKIEDEMPWYKYRNKIKKLVIEDGITEIGWNNFLECRNLESIQWPSTLERVYTGAFKNCTSLVEVTLPASVKEWYYCVFEGCTALKKVTLEEGVQFGEPGGFGFGRKMFQDCTSLETVILPKQLAVIPEEFVLGCPNIKEYNIPGEVVSLGSYPHLYARRLYLCPKQ